MRAVLEPLGRPLATDGVAGERADDPLYGPCIKRVQQRRGRSGLLCVGDGKMAAHAPRAFIAWAGDYSLCPLPQAQRAAGELEEALERVGSGAPGLRAVWRAQEQGEPKLIAQGDEHEVPMSVEAEGTRHAWTERRLVGRSVRHAEAAEGALRARVAKAKAQVEALNRRGRGRTRCADIATLRQAVTTIGQRHPVAACLGLCDAHPTMTRPVRASQERPAYVQEEPHATVAVRVDAVALETAVRRLGWRVDSTHQPAEQRSLAQAVVAYRSAYRVERRLGRLTGRPRSLRPMSGQRDDHATGLMRVLSLALRVWTLLECVVRRQWAAAGETVSGL